MDDWLWIEFSGLVIGEDSRRVQFTGDPTRGGMGPFWISRKGLRRILYTDGTWSEAIKRGRGVCVLEVAAWAARQQGLA